MEAIKLIGTSHNGILTVPVPKEYDEKELEIMIISAKDLNIKNGTIREDDEPGNENEREF